MRCLVQGCPNTAVPGTGSVLCKPCKEMLKSGVIPANAKPFLKCIPYMHKKLINIKTVVSNPELTHDAMVAQVTTLVADVEDDGE